MPDTVSIPSRFNGPLHSGNGGYSSGVVAGFLGGAAEVSLRRPVPLDTELRVVTEDGTARMLDGDELIAEGRATPDFGVDVPEPVTPEAAREATAHYRGAPDGVFSRCFVCGLSREDGFGVFAGAVEGRELVASPWTPPDWTAGEDGAVRPEFVWAVLDCPTYFASHRDDPDPLPPGVLARFEARVDAPVRPGVEHVVIAWPLGRDGRKRHAGVALLTAEGEPVASGRALLIEPRA